MKIFISYENLKRDFNGRMLLLSKLAESENVEEIYRGINFQNNCNWL